MKVKIEEPCHENWDQMKIGLISRHCDSCAKDVMDFTTMSRAEIIMHLLENKSESVCGRMRQDQFDFQHEDIPILIEAIKKKRPSNSFLIIALVCLSLASCSNEPQGKIDTPSGLNNKIERKIIGGSEHDVGMMQIELDTPQVIEPVVTIPEPPPPMPVGMIEMGDVVVMPEPPIHAPLPEPDEPEPIYREPTDDPLTFAEKMPEYPGGVETMMKFIKDNLNYPKFEKELGIEGNVYVQFVVERDGTLTNATVLKGVSEAKNFDREVKRVISIMPKWTPGENMGKISRVYMTLPFRFRIAD